MAKKGFHPEYFKVEILCTTCNKSFTTGSTQKNLKVDSCSNCHPFYTGDQRSYAADSRVEKFKSKYGLK